MSKHPNHRAAPRFRCRCYATLCATHESWPAHLLNVSTTGALVAVLPQHKLQSGDEIEVAIELDDEQSVEMRGIIAHVREHYIGLRCESMTENDRARLQHKLTTLNQH